MAATRLLGSVGLDDLVNSFITQFTVPSSRFVQLAQSANRQGRVSRIKEDRKPLVLDVRGYWIDAGGAFWRDFRAAIEGQSRAPLVLGDGTRFEMVDATIQGVRTAAGPVGVTPGQAWAWTMKVECYEPCVREVSPTLVNLGALTTGNGSYLTSFTVNYAGTYFAEPTWQWALVIPSGVSVTQLQLSNTTTNVTCRTSSLTLGAGTWTVLMDASGAVVASSGLNPTPNNNGYGLLAMPSVGFGVTVQQSGFASLDQDFTGLPPTLVTNPSPTIPPSAYANTVNATVTATGALTSASLSLLAPKRYLR